MRALISVSDKTGLIDFTRELVESHNVELIASGGTAAVLRSADLPVTSVEALTGLPPMLDGRVKTLHPAIHAGILARDSEADRATLESNGWPVIDLVVVNLYPFVEAIAQPDASLADAVENIDIGGVALIRAAAKNFSRVAVVVDPGDYGAVLDELAAQGSVGPETRRDLAEKAFATTAAYDTNITQYLLNLEQKVLPPALHIALPRVQMLRYGENPHQQAALYGPPGIGPLGGELLQGKPLSYNNLLDIDAAYGAAVDFGDDEYGPTLVIVKHLTPTGIAAAGSLAAAFEAALASDPVSAFGGVIAANTIFDEATALALGDLFVEAIAAPDFSEGALDALANRANCRLLRMKRLPQPGFLVRSVRGGLLAQTPDRGTEEGWQIVTERQPTDAEVKSLHFAWKAVAHVKSNAIVLGKGAATVGIGGGLPSRVDAVKLAASKAGDAAQGAVLASDAFFPFPDGPEAAAEVGITAIIQPGGSVRDELVVDACNRLGLAMVFTGVRHFRH